MVKNSKKEVLFVVDHFVDRYLERVKIESLVNGFHDIMCRAESGGVKDIFYRFTSSILGREVKIGDKFIQTEETVDINSKVFPTIELISSDL